MSNHDEQLRGNRYAARMRGFADGASAKAKRESFTAHPTLAPDYERGYETGRLQRSLFADASSIVTGFEPSPTRDDR